MKYQHDHLNIAKYIIFNHGIRSSFETYHQHFTDSLTWLSISSRLFLQKCNSLLSCFCKIKIPMTFAINKKYYTYVTITEHYKSVMRTKEKKNGEKRKKKSGEQKFRAFDVRMPRESGSECPWHQDSWDKFSRVRSVASRCCRPKLYGIFRTKRI